MADEADEAHDSQFRLCPALPLSVPGGRSGFQGGGLMSVSTGEGDARLLCDRRKSASINRYTLFGGKRRQIRRRQDRSKPLFVDLYSTRLFAALLLLLFLSLADGFLTLALIGKHLVAEANPVMAFFLGFGITPFMAGKLLLTALALVVFCLLKNVRVVRLGLSSAILVYLIVVAYELKILYDFLPGF